MSVYQKLNKARSILHQKAMVPSGHNKFANYKYFELGDFVPPIIEICNEVGIIPLVSFTDNDAKMDVVDVEDGSTITFTSPMSTAELKGCHPVQNLGAVETYVRRYLYQTAFEIVEHDALNATQGVEPPKVGRKNQPPTKPKAQEKSPTPDDESGNRSGWIPQQRFTPNEAYKHLRTLATEEEVKETLKNLGASRSSEITYEMYTSAVGYLCAFQGEAQGAA